MSEIYSAEWIPQSYLEAESLWEVGTSLEDFTSDIDVYINNRGPFTLTDVSMMEYPIQDHNIEKVDIQLNGWEAGSHVVKLTKKDGELHNTSLHEVAGEEFEWISKVNSIAVHGLDHEKDLDYGVTDD